jgi:hypothetical protein
MTTNYPTPKGNTMFRKLLASLAIAVTLNAVSTPKAVAATSSMTEFCVNNSPDGELSLRATPSMTSYTYGSLQNGECGIFIGPRPARSGAFVRATINGQRGWVKSKWIIRIDETYPSGC